MAVSMSMQFNRLVKPLQNYPWSDWDEGTEVVRFLVQDDKSHDEIIESKIVFKVSAKNRSVQRLETIADSTKRQEFLVSDEVGIRSAEHEIQGVSSVLHLDGEMVMATLTKLMRPTMNGSRMINNMVKQWTLQSDPSLVIREENEDEAWRIISLNKKVIVSGSTYPCVQIKAQKKINTSEIVVSKLLLCPFIPGHLVSESKAFYKLTKKNKTILQMMTTEQTVSYKQQQLATNQI